MLREPKQNPSSRWNWVLWWRVDQDDVEWQAAHYSELGFFRGFKGWSALALLFSATVTSAWILLTGASHASFVDAVMMLALAGFIHFGHRWAMIGAMLFWTFEKVMQITGNPGAIIFAVLWWGLYLHLFYMAFLVERRRRESHIDPEVFT